MVQTIVIEFIVFLIIMLFLNDEIKKFFYIEKSQCYSVDASVQFLHNIKIGKRRILTEKLEKLRVFIVCIFLILISFQIYWEADRRGLINEQLAISTHTINNNDESEEEEYVDYSDYDDFGYNDSRNQSIDDYHVVSGYERGDGEYVEPYVRGDPDGVEENNIEYMRENNDGDGLIEAYIDAYSN